MDAGNGIKVIASGVEQSFFFGEAEALLNNWKKQVSRLYGSHMDH